MMAAGDSGRIGANALLSSDIVTLQTMLAQAESLKSNISKILESRGQPTSQDSIPAVATPASMVEKQVPVSDAELNDNFALDANAQMGGRELRGSDSVDDSSMQID